MLDLGSHMVDIDDFRDAFDRLRRKLGAMKMPCHEVMGRGADQYGIGLGKLFQPRGDVRRFADDAVPLARRPRAEFADDD